MIQKTYSEKLRDPRWQKKRLEILNRDGFSCAHCSDTKSTLHVHHKCYLGVDPWETPNNLLITLCEECHAHEEALLKVVTANIVPILKECGFMAAQIGDLHEAFWELKNQNIHAVELLSLSILNCFNDAEVLDYVISKYEEKRERWVEERQRRNKEKAEFNEIFDQNGHF